MPHMNLCQLHHYHGVDPNRCFVCEQQKLRDETMKLRSALLNLLRRDEQNTCTHEKTHRGGALWEICDDCGAAWADDVGGKPKWNDPPEWVEARAALNI